MDEIKEKEPAICHFCHEQINPQDRIIPVDTGSQIIACHGVCVLRNVIGSVGHQMGQCECHGVEDVSEAGMTYREAAMAAVRFYNAVRRECKGAENAFRN